MGKVEPIHRKRRENMNTTTKSQHYVVVWVGGLEVWDFVNLEPI